MINVTLMDIRTGNKTTLKMADRALAEFVAQQTNSIITKISEEE